MVLTYFFFYLKAACYRIAHDELVFFLFISKDGFWFCFTALMDEQYEPSGTLI